MTTRETDWQIRLFANQRLIASGVAPSVPAIASEFAMRPREVADALHRLHQACALTIMAGGDARIEARHPLTGEIMRYAVEAETLGYDGGWLVHFAQPFRQ